MKSFQELIEDEKATLVDFSAEWCCPCKMLAPELKKLASLTGDNANIIKVDVDKNPEAAAKYGIRSVPTLMLFKSGNLLWRQSGVLSAEQMNQVINQYN